MEFPKKIERAIGAVSRLPGIGNKSAARLVLNIMKWSNAERADFTASIDELNDLQTCSDCGLYCEEALCTICQNESRKELGVICVVENVSDLIAIEKSQEFRGLYHILGGVLNPLLGVGPEQLKLMELKERCEKDNIKTLILAISPSVEGDATCSYLKHTNPEVQIERIGFGIPMGGTLEYLDSMTISKALENRKEFF